VGTRLCWLHVLEPGVRRKTRRSNDYGKIPGIEVPVGPFGNVRMILSFDDRQRRAANQPGRSQKYVDEEEFQ